MARQSLLASIMQTPLPSIAAQKRQPFSLDNDSLNLFYNSLNKHIFNNQLPKPLFSIKFDRDHWGHCSGYEEISNKRSGSYSVIHLNKKYYCVQWAVMVLAHEMCHQYQWDVDGFNRLAMGKSEILNHGPSFFLHKEKLAYFGIPLKIKHSTGRWFKYQNLFKT